MPIPANPEGHAANSQPALLPDVKDAQLGSLRCYVLVRKGGPEETNNAEKSAESIRPDRELTPE